VDIEASVVNIVSGGGDCFIFLDGHWVNVVISMGMSEWARLDAFVIVELVVL
jgi:hypothetical protein